MRLRVNLFRYSDNVGRKCKQTKSVSLTYLDSWLLGQPVSQFSKKNIFSTNLSIGPEGPLQIVYLLARKVPDIRLLKTSPKAWAVSLKITYHMEFPFIISGQFTIENIWLITIRIVRLIIHLDPLIRALENLRTLITMRNRWNHI